MVVFWSVAPVFSFRFGRVSLGERRRRSYIAIVALALVGIAIARPLSGGCVAGDVPGVGMIVGGANLLASGGWLSPEMARRRAEASAA